MGETVQHNPQYASLVKIIVALRKKSSEFDDLITETKVPRRTLYGILSALEEAGVVVKEKRMLYWYENAEMKSYNTRFEAENWLDHSKNIVLGLKHAFGEFRFTDSTAGEEYQKYALAHLRTAYPSYYDDHERLGQLREKIAQDEDCFVKKVVTRLSTQIPGAPSEVGKLILNDIKEDLTGHEPSYLHSLEVSGEEVVSNPFHLGPRELFESIKDFMTEEERLEENLQDCREIISGMKEYFDLTLKSKENIGRLAQMVDNGTPLNGSCDICPKVKINL